MRVGKRGAMAMAEVGRDLQAGARLQGHGELRCDAMRRDETRCGHRPNASRSPRLALICSAGVRSEKSFVVARSSAWGLPRLRKDALFCSSLESGGLGGR